MDSSLNELVYISWINKHLYTQASEYQWQIIYLFIGSNGWVLDIRTPNVKYFEVMLLVWELPLGLLKCTMYCAHEYGSRRKAKDHKNQNKPY